MRAGLTAGGVKDSRSQFSGAGETTYVPGGLRSTENDGSEGDVSSARSLGGGSIKVTSRVISVRMMAPIRTSDRRFTVNTNDRGHPVTSHPAMIHSDAAQPSGLGLVPVERNLGDTEANPMPTRERLVLSVDETAYLLNISRSLAYELIARGELPALRLGRRIVIPRATLEELLDAVTR